jgi:hypothetical protein
LIEWFRAVGTCRGLARFFPCFGFVRVIESCSPLRRVCLSPRRGVGRSKQCPAVVAGHTPASRVWPGAAVAGREFCWAIALAGVCRSDGKILSLSGAPCPFRGGIAVVRWVVRVTPLLAIRHRALFVVAVERGVLMQARRGRAFSSSVRMLLQRAGCSASCRGLWSVGSLTRRMQPNAYRPIF